MKKIVLAAFILCGIVAQSQILTPVTPTTPGIHQQRAKLDSAAMLPEKVGLLLNTSDSTFQMFFNKLDSTVWAFSRYTGYFRVGRNVSDSLQLSDSIWQRNDSIFYKANKLEKFSGIILQPIQWTDPQVGDHNVIAGDLHTIINQHSSDQICNSSSNIGLTYLFGTTYAYNSGFYSIACQQYNITTGGTISADVGSAGSGEFREDLVYLDASGIHIRKGDNSIGGIGLRPTPDPATEIGIGYIRIDENNTTPTGPTADIIYDENSGEWTHTTFGTITAVFNYTGVTAYHGTNSIHITAANNNSGIIFAKGSTLSSADQQKFSLWIRNTSALNNARNIVIRKYLGNNQVTGSAAITITTAARGYNRTLLNTWQLISFDFSLFGGQDPFDRIRATFTGTGGTVNIEIDYIRNEFNVIGGGTGDTGPSITQIGTDAGTYVSITPNAMINIIGGTGHITTAVSGGNNIVISGYNLYDNDGTLAADRSLSGNGHSLSMDEIKLFQITNRSSVANNNFILTDGAGIIPPTGGMQVANLAGDSASYLEMTLARSTLARGVNVDATFGTAYVGIEGDTIMFKTIVSNQIDYHTLLMDMKGLPDGSGYDAVLAYNSANGQIGFSTTLPGGTGAFLPLNLATGVLTTVTGDQTNSLLFDQLQNFEADAYGTSRHSKINLSGTGDTYLQYEVGSSTSYFQLNGGGGASFGTQAGAQMFAGSNFIIEGALVSQPIDSAAYFIAISATNNWYAVAAADVTGGGGGGGSDSPDRINGTATGDVNSDLSSNNLNFSNVNNLKVTTPTYSGGLIFARDNGKLYLGDGDGSVNGNSILIDDANNMINVSLSPTGVFTYAADYSANYTSLSLITKQDAWFTSGTSTLTGNTFIVLGSNNLNMTADDGGGNQSTIFQNFTGVGLTSNDNELDIETNGVRVVLDASNLFTYDNDYSTNILTNDRAITDVGTVKILATARTENISVAVATTGHIMSATETYVFLPDLTGQANRILTLPTGVSGKHYFIVNRDNSAFNWSVIGGTIKNNAGSTVSTLADLTTYELIYDGTNFQIIL